MIELQFFILGGRTQDTLINLNRVNHGCCPFIGSTETSTCLRFFVIMMVLGRGGPGNKR